mmetsp:Transcript_26641/g.74957  ORF Transcript_26641/g.74957 Transcript_26641/m.74957 type:complete len:234 (-) Transcript_26641:256-957(-)
MPPLRPLRPPAPEPAPEPAAEPIPGKPLKKPSASRALPQPAFFHLASRSSSSPSAPSAPPGLFGPLSASQLLFRASKNFFRRSLQASAWAPASGTPPRISAVSQLLSASANRPMAIAAAPRAACARARPERLGDKPSAAVASLNASGQRPTRTSSSARRITASAFPKAFSSPAAKAALLNKAKASSTLPAASAAAASSKGPSNCDCFFSSLALTLTTALADGALCGPQEATQW